MARKLIGNSLPISAKVSKAKLAMNLVHIGKISCLYLLSKCLCAVFMAFWASIRQYILDLLPNRLCRLLQISAKHCRLVSVPPLGQRGFRGLNISREENHHVHLFNWYVAHVLPPHKGK